MPKPKNGVYKNCVNCGTSFYVPKYRENSAKFCSVDCLNHGQYEVHEKICEGCGKTFKVSNSRINRKFCSLECRTLKTIDAKQRRARMRTWRAAHSSKSLKGPQLKKVILAHTGELKCYVCGYDEYDFCLDTHHIDNNPNNNDPSNLICLCAICHRKLHKGVISIS